MAEIPCQERPDRECGRGGDPREGCEVVGCARGTEQCTSREGDAAPRTWGKQTCEAGQSATVPERSRGPACRYRKTHSIRSSPASRWRAAPLPDGPCSRPPPALPGCIQPTGCEWRTTHCPPFRATTLLPRNTGADARPYAAGRWQLPIMPRVPPAMRARPRLNHALRPHRTRHTRGQKQRVLLVVSAPRDHAPATSKTAAIRMTPTQRHHSLRRLTIFQCFAVMGVMVRAGS